MKTIKQLIQRAKRSAGTNIPRAYNRRVALVEYLKWFNNNAVSHRR